MILNRQRKKETNLELLLLTFEVLIALFLRFFLNKFIRLSLIKTIRFVKIKWACTIKEVAFKLFLGNVEDSYPCIIAIVILHQ